MYPLLKLWWEQPDRSALIDQTSTGASAKSLTTEADITWVQANLETLPPWNFVELDNATTVTQIEVNQTLDWGAMKLAANLNRPIRLVHGKGCEISARPADTNTVYLGGRVRIEETFELS